jgi:hypothetical protein
MRLFDSEATVISRADVLAVLEAGPQSTGELSRWLQQPGPVVHAALVTMANDNLVVRVATTRAWALPEMVPSNARAVLVRFCSRKLRQPRLASEIVKADDSPSWWCDLPTREAFDAAAARELPRMQGSKMANKVMVTEG